MRLSCSSSRSRLRPFAVSTNARSALCIARSSVASCALATVLAISSRNESSSEVRVASTLRNVESKRLRWSVNASLVSTARSRVRDSSVPNRATWRVSVSCEASRRWMSARVSRCSRSNASTRCLLESSFDETEDDVLAFSAFSLAIFATLAEVLSCTASSSSRVDTSARSRSPTRVSARSARCIHVVRSVRSVSLADSSAATRSFVART